MFSGGLLRAIGATDEMLSFERRETQGDAFMAKLQAAADPKFNSPAMPQAVRLYRSSVPGPDTAGVVLVIEYADMHAYGNRTDFENRSVKWRELFEANTDSPETLLSVELLTQLS